MAPPKNKIKSVDLTNLENRAKFLAKAKLALIQAKARLLEDGVSPDQIEKDLLEIEIAESSTPQIGETE